MEIRKATSISSIILLPVLILFVVLFVFFLYTFLHEAGHALVGLIFGQTLTEFDVSFWDLSARAGLTGGELTQNQLAVRTVAGVCLPILVWIVFILFVPRKSTFILETLKLVGSMAVINTLLVWIILPVLFLFGKAPSDDVMHFLNYSQMPPLLLMTLALILYVGGWTLFLSKIDGLKNEFLLFSTKNAETLVAGTRTTIPVMVSIIVVGVGLVWTLNSPASKNSPDRFSPPQDFESVAQIDLSERAYVSETLKQFELDKPSVVAVFLAIRNINTTYFDLSITGPDGFRSTILHGEGYNAAQDGGLWDKNLPAGTYQVTLTSHQSPGTASIYFKVH
jgi:hypothetical protein